jgi:hypothetical protein
MFSCEEDQLFIEDSGIHGLRYCRTMKYYVNPNSVSVLGIGTRLHPYKNVNLALIEMFNYYSNVDGLVYVRLAKGMTYNIRHNLGTLNNITKVIFEPYDPNLNADSANEYGEVSF